MQNIEVKDVSWALQLKGKWEQKEAKHTKSDDL